MIDTNKVKIITKAAEAGLARLDIAEIARRADVSLSTAYRTLGGQLHVVARPTAIRILTTIGFGEAEAAELIENARGAE